MACSTGEGFPFPELQADPVETHNPRSPSRVTHFKLECSGMITIEVNSSLGASAPTTTIPGALASNLSSNASLRLAAESRAPDFSSHAWRAFKAASMAAIPA